MKSLVYKVELDPEHVAYNEFCKTLGHEVFINTFELKGCKVVVEVYSDDL